MNIKDQMSFKRIALSKANAQIVGVTAAAAFVTVFCLVAGNYFLGLRSYQAKIISADQTADNNLKADVAAKNRLVNSYERFVSKTPNLLGQTDTTGQYNYNNATIILDALPSQYDFPALISTLQKLFTLGSYDVTSIGGSDESATTSSTPSSNPQPVAMPFSFTVSNTNYQAMQTLFQQMLASIRPLQIDNVSISGADTNLTITVNAHTYFQPGKAFKIGSEVVNR